MVENFQPVNMNSVKYSSPARLKEERARLGLSQVALAEALGVTKWTVINYEKAGGRGTPIPADLLSACARLGMDVQYVLTGVRSSNLNRVAEESGAYRRAEREEVPLLSGEEQKLLEKYRRLKPQQRSHAQAIVDALIPVEERVKGKPARRKPRAKR
jgi:transcriptional regulator with XRE-family HTH domain